MNAKLRTPALLALLCLLVWAVFAGDIQAGKIQIPDGTEVKVIFDPNLQLNSGKVEKGIPLMVNLYEPIVIGGITVVEKGAIGTAVVEDVQKSGKPGKPGFIKVRITELEPKGEFEAVDAGAKIKLDGVIENKGGGKKLLSFLLGFGLIIKGGQGQIDTSKPYTAKVAESIILEN